jgi:hypothetical protein
VRAAATRSIAPLRKRRRASLLLPMSGFRMPIAISGERFAITRRFVRTNLDAVVWKEILRLPEDPSVIQEELDRLLSAYPEGLVSLEQLRSRMPELRKQQQAVQAEWQSFEAATRNPTQVPAAGRSARRFAWPAANTLEMTERRKIVRMLVKELLVRKDSVTIRHSVRIPNAGPDPSGPSGTLSLPLASHQRPMCQPGPHYFLRSGCCVALGGQAYLRGWVFAGRMDRPTGRRPSGGAARTILWCWRAG